MLNYKNFCILHCCFNLECIQRCSRFFNQCFLERKSFSPKYQKDLNYIFRSLERVTLSIYFYCIVYTQYISTFSNDKFQGSFFSKYTLASELFKEKKCCVQNILWHISRGYKFVLMFSKFNGVLFNRILCRLITEAQEKKAVMTNILLAFLTSILFCL